VIAFDHSRIADSPIKNLGILTFGQSDGAFAEAYVRDVSLNFRLADHLGVGKCTDRSTRTYQHTALGLNHLGMNEITPSTAPPSTSSAGLTLYCSKISRTPTAIAAVSTPKIAPFAIVKQPASRRPIETGASPR
jgi:hypothetical protein